VRRAGEAGDDDRGAGRPQGIGTLVRAADQGADRQAAPQEPLHHGAAHAADPARGARDKNGIRHCSALPVSPREHETSVEHKSSGPCSALDLGCAARSWTCAAGVRSISRLSNSGRLEWPRESIICLRLSISVKSRSATTAPSPDRRGPPSKVPSGATIAVKQPPEIGPMPQPVSFMICACCSASSQAVAHTTKHADSSACWRPLICVCSANRSPKIEPGYIAEWICSPSAISAYRANGL